MPSTDHINQALQRLMEALSAITAAQHLLIEIHPLAREIKPYQALTVIGQDLAQVMQDIGRIKL